MASPFYHQFQGLGDNTPSRSTSAPPMLDENMLFAFPVASDYTVAFSDIRNDQMYEEFYECYKEKLSMPPPLQEPLSQTQFRKLSTISDNEEGQPRSRTTSFLVNNMVDTCIKEEDQPSQNNSTNNIPFTEPPGFSTPASAPPTIPEFEPTYDQGEFFGYSQFTPQHVYTQALEMARDQVGCRLLQKKLEERNPFTIQAIYDQIMLQIGNLMIDPFGNYLVQKLLEVCDEPILESILSQVTPSITQISLNQHGTRAIQKLIEVIAKYEQHIPSVISAIRNHVITLIKDLNGNHVIQKCLNALGATYNQFIYEISSQHVIEIATHRHGCCVLQRCIDAATPKQLELLVDYIVINAVELVKDAFGNYVVQYVIDLNSPNINARLAFIFIQSMQELSTQKFSSNVIEKCLQQNRSEVQQAMIQEIGQPKNLARMLPDQYANYVVQRALSLAAPALLERMIKEIKPLMDELRRSQFGKRIYSKLAKKYPELTEKHGNNFKGF
mmetsp:Transcript_487/g.519  ORF Transcript_487/g.519 Transcript_487/m.519 type:complete len:498 (+) Transcript_487:20-1513(+)